MISKTPIEADESRLEQRPISSSPPHRYATTSNWWGTDAIQSSKPVTSMVRREVTTAPACIACETEPRSCGRQDREIEVGKRHPSMFSPRGQMLLEGQPHRALSPQTGMAIPSVMIGDAEPERLGQGIDGPEIDFR